jgi:spermidine/putrescine ABC transporter ATP-binding subunit
VIGSATGSRGLQVAIDDVWRRYGAVTAVGGVSLDVGAGEFVSLLGPSGSGKTTLLMMLAGFEEPEAGRISIGNRDVTHVPPNKRDVAMVFQRYALFPHMTVAENIAFPLKMRRMARADRDAHVRRVLELVKMTGYQDRKPAEISGGQQQRVALARAIVFDPPVILMDEPLGALDKKLRQHMQIELKQLQQRLGATVVYVTHDQEEALHMSDRVAVMNHGKLLQIGSPRDLYDRPADAFVADFLGEMNFLDGTVSAVAADLCTVEVGGDAVEARPHDGAAVGAPVRVAVRPESIVLGRAGAGGLDGRVVQSVFNGASMIVLIETRQGATLQAGVNPRSDLADLKPGEAVVVGWNAADAQTFAQAAA